MTDMLSHRIIAIIAIVSLIGVSFALGWLVSTWRIGRVLLRGLTARRRRAARANRSELRTAYGTGRDLAPRARDDFDFGQDETLP